MPEENKAGWMVKYSGPPWMFDAAGMASLWLAKANQLHRAAWLIWQAVQNDFDEVGRAARHDYDFDRDGLPQNLPSVMEPFVFLASLAIENLLKGMLVIAHPEYVKDGKLHGEVITRHDLLRLAREVNVDLDADERSFCELGTSAIESWGRYPISKSVSKMMSQIIIKGTVGGVFEHLFDRLAAMTKERFLLRSTDCAVRDVSTRQRDA